VPMRAAELATRAGKQPDGSAKTREAKVVTLWTAESRDAEGTPMRDPGSVTYSAAIESAATSYTSPERSDFAERVLREATRRGFTQASRCAVLGDGSTWIWNTARELFPRATQILDRYHAKEALHRTAPLIFGATSESKQWATARCTDQMCAVHLSQSRSHALSEISRPRFCTSTGVLEAGCKVAIGARLKRAGMHWTVHGANAIIALRCCKLSGRFEDFWERRRDRAVA